MSSCRSWYHVTTEFRVYFSGNPPWPRHNVCHDHTSGREESTCAAFRQRCRGVKGHERGGAKRRARGAPSTQHTRLSRVRIALLLMGKKRASFGGEDRKRKGRGGKAYGGAGGAAAHWRTCTRWLLESATTMRPSLSMAMPPQGLLNCPLPEPLPPKVRTWAPSL